MILTILYKIQENFHTKIFYKFMDFYWYIHRLFIDNAKKKTVTAPLNGYFS